ncbi:MAG TPA: class I SAM-dependent methyltransferase [Longimicrobiales bacterium]
MPDAPLSASAPYSPLWYSTFLDTIPDTQTAAEVSFLQRQLPVGEFRRIMDLCCGSGRHAIPLAAAGYDVTGVDRDAAAIARARSRSRSSARFVVADVRAIPATGGWDGALVMWASFGYFSADANAELLRGIAALLRRGGRVVLDVYNSDWFVTRQGERRSERAGVRVIEHKRVTGDRLSVELHYEGHETVDRFSWQVFTPSGLVDMLERTGLCAVTVCSGFDEHRPVTIEDARMQIVAEGMERSR